MFKVCHKTDIGLIRDANEDACNSGLTPDGTAWAVVCDGMGGVHGGNVASSVAVETIIRQYRAFFKSSQARGDNAIRNLMTSAVYNANSAVYERACAEPALAGMGTTVVTVVVTGEVAHVVHVGDSRAYLIGPDGAQQLTTDHSMVQEMVDNGRLTEQQARVHPQKNIITRALGVEPTVLVDYGEFTFAGRSLVLLCTDGLSNYLEPETLYALSQQYTGHELAEQLIEKAKAGGGGDNITVAIIEN